MGKKNSVSALHAAGLSIIAFLSGSIAAFPLYGAFWWWDLLAHFSGGGVVVATLALLVSDTGRRVVSVVFVAIAWEAFESLIPLGGLPIWVNTGDWATDIVATVAGGVVVAAAHHYLPVTSPPSMPTPKAN